MHTEPFEPEDEAISQPIVQWFPRVGALRTISPDVVAVAGLVVGAVGALALIGLGRRIFGGDRMNELEVDRLVVRKLTVLED